MDNVFPPTEDENTSLPDFLSCIRNSDDLPILSVVPPCCQGCVRNRLVDSRLSDDEDLFNFGVYVLVDGRLNVAGDCFVTDVASSVEFHF